MSRNGKRQVDVSEDRSLEARLQMQNKLEAELAESQGVRTLPDFEVGVMTPAASTDGPGEW